MRASLAILILVFVVSVGMSMGTVRSVRQDSHSLSMVASNALDSWTETAEGVGGSLEAALWALVERIQASQETAEMNRPLWWIIGLSASFCFIAVGRERWLACRHWRGR